MLLRNKILIVFALFFGFLILLTPKTKAVVQANNETNFNSIRYYINEMSYADANEFVGVCDSSTVSSYPYVCVFSCISGNVTYKTALFTKNTTNVYCAPILYDNDNNTTQFRIYCTDDCLVFDNNVLQRYEQGVQLNGNTGVSSVYSNYDIPVKYYLSQRWNDTSFFILKAELLPLPLALQTVSRSLVPTQIMGTLAVLVPIAVVVFSAFLLIFLIRSRIWLKA